MCNTTPNNIELLLKTSFESGYMNASSSLSQMIRRKGAVINFDMGSVKLGANFLEAEEYKNFSGSYLLLTTEIFGEVVGKNYLFLSKKDVEIFTSAMPSTNDTELREEFIKELDNILSAAVITKLSNALNKRMYGNVPQLIGTVNCHIDDLINDDFSDEMEEAYINSIYFTFEDGTDARPLFVWVLDKSSIEASH
jgi:chemotaxis protein CheY-P-specific phosphatase CheC